MAEKREKQVSISIPVPLLERIKKRINKKNFHSVSHYITYTLREALAREELRETDQTFSQEDEEKVKKRLKDLGYLD